MSISYVTYVHKLCYGWFTRLKDLGPGLVIFEWNASTWLFQYRIHCINLNPLVNYIIYDIYYTTYIICYNSIFSINSIIVITIFTPHTIPSNGITLINESVFLKLFRRKKNLSEENPQNNDVQDGPTSESSENSLESMLDIFKKINIWLLLLAACAWELRRNTHQGRYPRT